MSTTQQPLSWFTRHPRRALCLVVFFVGVIFVAADLLLGFVLLKDRDRVYSPYYHHGFRPQSVVKNAVWESSVYPRVTNSLGLLDRQRRTVARHATQKRVVFIGDSFVEGIGVAYPKTFVGLFESAVAPQNIEVLNAGVSSYSPKLYYFKMKYLIEHAGLTCDELFVFIDLSDLSDEIAYQDVGFQTDGYGRIFKEWVRKNSFTARRVSDVIRHQQARRQGKNSKDYWGWSERPISRVDIAGYDFWARYFADRIAWVFEPRFFYVWGNDALFSADAYMELLYQLCRQHAIRMHIVVYPWPELILKNDHADFWVQHWKGFAAVHDIGFVDLFPAFMNTGRQAAAVIMNYFVDGDVHWNENGHQFVAESIGKYFAATPR